jgi:hypothetical protein
VRVHPHDVLAARVAQPDVQAGGRGPARVVEEPDPRIVAGELLDQLARAVLGAAVHEQELDLAVEALGAHRGDGVADEGLLVQDGNEDAGVDGAHGPRTIWARRDTKPG